MKYLLAALIFVYSPVAVACGTVADTGSDSQNTASGSTVEKRDTTVETNGETATTTTRSSATTVSRARGVFFPRAKPSDALGASARIRGKLVADKEGCLRIRAGRDERGVVPIWPSYFDLSTERDEFEILDGEGDFVARVGDEIDTGGGVMRHPDTTEPLKGGGIVSRQLARKLSERCPGQYWLVNPSEDHIQ
jgi:hypothetical protein